MTPPFARSHVPNLPGQLPNVPTLGRILPALHCPIVLSQQNDCAKRSSGRWLGIEAHFRRKAVALAMHCLDEVAFTSRQGEFAPNSSDMSVNSTVRYMY